jgi:putative transposase
MDLISSSYSVGQNIYHLEWCPKYRYHMFRSEEIKKLCEDVLREIAQRHHITIIELSVMPDHIHMVVNLPTTMSVSRALHLLKGTSSHEIFKQISAFHKRYPRGAFWSPGKFYRTVGDADADTVINYVRNHQFQQTTIDCFPGAP